MGIFVPATNMPDQGTLPSNFGKPTGDRRKYDRRSLLAASFSPLLMCSGFESAYVHRKPLHRTCRQSPILVQTKRKLMRSRYRPHPLRGSWLVVTLLLAGTALFATP